jgi:hypothetical protein
VIGVREGHASTFRLTVATLGIALVGGCSTAGASTIPWAGGDESRVYFLTDAPLLPSVDKDASLDIYERSGGALSLITSGDPACQPGCGNGSVDVETAPAHRLVPGGLLFSTAESLVPADEDDSVDIYRRSEAGLELVSQGPNGFNDPFGAEFQAVSEDGSAVSFTTKEPLVAADADSSQDVYQRIDGTTVLESQGPNGFNGAFDAEWGTATPDGSAVFFLTAESALSLDTDSSVDLYKRQGGVTTLISTAVKPFNGEFDAGGPVMTSDDGDCTVFMTAEPLAGEQDDDQQSDIYMRCGGTTTLVSGGTYTPPNQGGHPVELDAFNPHAKQVVFDSEQILNYEDRDATGPDVFEWYYGKTIMASQGPAEPYFPPPEAAEFLAFAPVGYGRVYFSTAEPLVAEDTDGSPDIYERELEVPDYGRLYSRAEGTTRLASLSLKSISGPFTPTFYTVSADGSRVLFTTAEQLVNSDTDGSVDLYERLGGYTTRLLSAGQINGNGALDVSARGDGERPLFTTAEQLVPGDTDSEPDLYERVATRTQLLSTAVPDPSAPGLSGTSPASPSNVNNPSVRGTAEPGSTIDVFAGATCAGEPIASGTAADFGSVGLTVSVPDNSTTEFTAHTVNADGIAGPCSSPIEYVEDSTAGPASLVGVRPGGPANDNLPLVSGTAEGDATVLLFADAACHGSAAARGSGAELVSAGVGIPVPDDSTTSISAVAIDPAGNASACAGPLTYTEDSTAPQTKIVEGPGRRSHDRTPSFKVHSDDAGAHFTCSVDAKALRRCPPFFLLPRLALGRHEVTIAAVDRAGNVDATPARKSWRLVRKRHRRGHSRLHH